MLGLLGLKGSSLGGPRHVVSYPDPFSLYFSTGVNCNLPAIRLITESMADVMLLLVVARRPFQPWLLTRAAILSKKHVA